MSAVSGANNMFADATSGISEWDIAHNKFFSITKTKFFFLISNNNILDSLQNHKVRASNHKRKGKAKENNPEPSGVTTRQKKKKTTEV